MACEPKLGLRHFTQQRRFDLARERMQADMDKLAARVIAKNRAVASHNGRSAIFNEKQYQTTGQRAQWRETV